MAENSTKAEWRGWRRQPPSSDSTSEHQGIAIHAGPLPGRKSIALYTMDYTDGNVMHVHAYFRSEEEALKFLRYFDVIMTGHFDAGFNSGDVHV
jgi:hypothetical protein